MIKSKALKQSNGNEQDTLRKGPIIRRTTRITKKNQRREEAKKKTQLEMGMQTLNTPNDII